jgi:prepilin-type N-terminal cleavage/methylation domain-containing protein
MNLNLSTRAYKKMKLYPIYPASGPKQAALSRSTFPAGPRALRAMTLTELLVAVAVGSLVLMVVATVFTTSARSCVTMGNYVSMDASSRNAVDHMTLQIRQAGALTEFSPTHLKFSLAAQPSSFLVYDWDSATGCLTESKPDGTVTTLLTKCDALTFSLVDAAFISTTNRSTCKGLSVNWKCSRTMLGNKSTTEDMQQALIVIRNKLS